MTDLILHHYPNSPFSEKVRVAFGIKQLAWKSVVIPNIMPKPDLMPLTGGYRKTPVLQVGADIYCDTQLIMLEIERRCPKPPLAAGRPGGRGAGARDVDRPQHLLVGGRRGDGRDRRPAARGLQEGPQRLLRPAVRRRPAQGGAAVRARADLRPAGARRADAARRPAVPAGRRAEPGRLRALQSGVVPAGAAWARATRRRRSTGCPRSSNGPSA